MPNFSKSASQFHSADDISFTAPPPMVISLSPEFMARIGALEGRLNELERHIEYHKTLIENFNSRLDVIIEAFQYHNDQLTDIESRLSDNIDSIKRLERLGDELVILYHDLEKRIRDLKHRTNELLDK